MMDTKLVQTLLIGLAALSLVILGILGVLALRHGGMDANSAGMIGVIVTGLIAFSKDIIQAIRGYSMSAQLGKVTDQLAQSGPIASDGPTGTPSDPVAVKEVS
jgi:hypothetical protein